MDLTEARAGGFEQQSRHPWEQARLALTLRLIRAHGALAPGAVVLDIGCGDTFVVGSLASVFPDVSFYAVDSAFTPQVMARLGVGLLPNVSLCASLEEVPATTPASLILLMDVLEHVGDDRGLLNTLVAGPLCGASTRFLITVPAHQALYSSHDEFLGHHRRYSLASLRALVGESGLQPLQVGFLFTTLLPIRALTVLRERLRPSAVRQPSGLAAWRGGAGAARALARVLEWDGRLALSLLRAGIRLPGLSLFAVCRTSA